MKEISIQTIANAIEGTLEGNAALIIKSPEQIEFASEGQITFIGSKKYTHLWQTSNASAVIINDGIAVEVPFNKAVIKVKNADLAMAQVLDLFADALPQFDMAIHSTAVVDATAIMGEACQIGANCFVGKNVVLGNNVTIHPNVTVFDHTVIGDGTTIWSGVVIREKTVIGKQCIIHSNSTIGADGFGYRPSADGEDW